MVVNGRRVTAVVAPRTHLADFLRETLLLTGTHLGCEHGVCGACTVLLDGVPVRSCIAYAAMCDGARVQTIEGLDDDPVMSRLRIAFTRAHALQCGYCTPGMLVTARDIVLRLPDADDHRVRLELAGNLCRCTGYNGIVKAIRMVLDERLEVSAPPAASLPRRNFAVPRQEKTARAGRPGHAGGSEIALTLPLDLPPEAVWPALRDPALIVGCVPGASLTETNGEVLQGEIVVQLGPVRARFSGTAQVRYEDASQSGEVSGEGRDSASATRLSATAGFALRATATGSVLQLDVTYALRGPLVQLARAPIVQAVAADLAATAADTLQARLRGDVVTVRPLSGPRLLLRLVWRWLRG